MTKNPSPTTGNGISMEDLRRSSLSYSTEIGEIGLAINAISDLLESSKQYGPSYILASLGKRLADLASDIDEMPRNLRAEEASFGEGKEVRHA